MERLTKKFQDGQVMFIDRSNKNKADNDSAVLLSAEQLSVNNIETLLYRLAELEDVCEG